LQQGGWRSITEDECEHSSIYTYTWKYHNKTLYTINKCLLKRDSTDPAVLLWERLPDTEYTEMQTVA
jgi:hypothetical protein